MPLAVLAREYTISYVPSGSVLARLKQKHRPLSAASALALGDPVFEGAPAAPPPDHGLKRGPKLARLPGTRSEALALASLVKDHTLLVGSRASEQALFELSSSGKLRGFRLIHLGTHALIDLDRPERSSLALARDRLPTPTQNAEAAARGRRTFTGELTVGDVLREWMLDADLVVLSGGQTGLGKDARGDGLLGFAHAFLSRGARSVVLSRWAVDDVATTLLMERFYRNLLARKPVLKRAEALAEAQRWLRELTQTEALARMGALTGGVVRSTVGVPPPVLKGGPRGLPPGDRPFAHPYYWAPFVLLGEPD